MDALVRNLPVFIFFSTFFGTGEDKFGTGERFLVLGRKFGSARSITPQEDTRSKNISFYMCNYTNNLYDEYPSRLIRLSPHTPKGPRVFYYFLGNQ